MSGEYIYSGGFWDSKACAVCARWDRSGAAAPNSAPKIVWQFLEPSLVLLQQSTDQSEKSCEDNFPVSSNISKPNSAPKRCYRIGSASVATCMIKWAPKRGLSGFSWFWFFSAVNLPICWLKMIFFPVKSPKNDPQWYMLSHKMN